MLSPEEQQRIEEDLKMFDRLIEESPYIQQIKAREVAKGRRSDILSIIKAHYPQMTDLAQQKVTR